MTDNVGYTPGSGETIASDDVGGVQFQRMKLALGAGGIHEGDVATDRPLPVQVLGEAIEALEAMRYALQALTRTIGLMQPDTAARMRVVVDAITANLTLATITTVGTVTTVTTLTNQSQIGGVSCNDQIPALMAMRADGLRRNISVT